MSEGVRREKKTKKQYEEKYLCDLGLKKVEDSLMVAHGNCTWKREFWEGKVQDVVKEQ